MKIYKIAQMVPPQYRPTTETPFIYSQILRDTTSRTRSGGRSNKEYIIRLYYFRRLDGFDSKYAVIAFNGSIGSTLRRQFKGAFAKYRTAGIVAENLLREKVESGYRVIDEQENFHRRDIPGRYAGINTIEVNPEAVEREVANVPEMTEAEEEKGEVLMWQNIVDGTHTIEEAIEQNAIPFMVETVRNIVMGESQVFNPEKAQDQVEEFIHLVLNSNAKGEIFKLPKDFFDKIGLPLADREMVQEYFQSTEIVGEDSFEHLLAHRNWYKRVPVSK